MSSIAPVDPAGLTAEGKNGVRLRDEAGELVAIRCSTCRVHLPREAFPASVWQRGAGRCRACWATYTRDRHTRGVDWQSRNPQAYRKATRESARRTLSTHEGREANRKASRESYRRRLSTPEGREANRESSRESARRTRSTPEGRESARKANRESYRRNPAANKRGAHRRRTRLRGNGTFLRTSRDSDRQLRRQSHRCLACGVPFGPEQKATEEHLIPVSRGGCDSIGNVAYTCRKCNHGIGGKHARTLTEWRKLNGWRPLWINAQSSAPASGEVESIPVELPASA